MRVVLRLLCGVVIASAAIIVWTRTALAVVLGPQLTGVFLWIAAGGSLCAVITLAWARKPGRRRRRPAEPPAGSVARGDRRRVSTVRTDDETLRWEQNQVRRAAYTRGGDRYG